MDSRGLQSGENWVVIETSLGTSELGLVRQGDREVEVRRPLSDRVKHSLCHHSIRKTRISDPECGGRETYAHT